MEPELLLTGPEPFETTFMSPEIVEESLDESRSSCSTTRGPDARAGPRHRRLPMTVRNDATTWPALARRSVRRWPAADQVGILVLILGIVLAALVIPPVFILITRSFSITNPDATVGGFTFAHYLRFFTNSDLYESLFNSLVFAVFSTVLALLFGGTLTWLVERTNTRFKGLAYVTTIISMGTPYTSMSVPGCSCSGGPGRSTTSGAAPRDRSSRSSTPTLSPA